MAKTIHASDIKHRTWTENQLIEALSKLEPLKKPHGAWRLGRNVREAPKDSWLFKVAEQYHRIVGGRVSIALGDGQTMRLHLDQLGRYTTPYSIDVPVFVNWSPMRKSKVDLHDFDPISASEFWNELEAFTQRIEWLKVNRFNVEAVMLDGENYVADGPRGDLATKNGLFYAAVKKAFPRCHVVWYGAHHVRRDGQERDGWGVYPRFAGPTDMAGLPLYYPFHHWDQIESARRTIDELGFHRRLRPTIDSDGLPIMAHVSLASSWFASQGEPAVWANGYDRPGDRSTWFGLGSLINNPWYAKPDQIDEYFDNRRIKYVQFWPEPFDPMMVTEWAIAFHAYVCGANHVTDVEL